jgi:iron(III) transport system ATP-binding protein
MLEVSDLRFSYNARGAQPAPIIRSISFRLNQGEFYSLLGPSGCGKSTTLRCVAGLETPTGGSISINNEIVFSHAPSVFVPAERRQIGMVFQSYAIWPHMSVLENVAFPLLYGRKRLSRAEARTRALQALDLVRLTQLVDRPAPFLSGGQQQRIALARALALQPAVLLLDEPLSNLDALLRDEMRSEIRRLVRRTGLTTLFVTHDQTEALSLSDRFAVMSEGSIVQEGTPEAVYSHPRTTFVASFLGNANLIPGRILGPCSRRAAASVVDTTVGKMIGIRSPLINGANAEVAILCRPEDVILHETADELRPNCMRGQVISRAYFGSGVSLMIDVGGLTINAYSQRTNWNEGDSVVSEFPIEHSQIVMQDAGAKP